MTTSCSRLRQPLRSRHRLPVLRTHAVHVRWLIPAARCRGVDRARRVTRAQYMTRRAKRRKRRFPTRRNSCRWRRPMQRRLAALGAPAGWSPQIFDARRRRTRTWVRLIVDQVIGKSEADHLCARARCERVRSRRLEILEYREIARRRSSPCRRGASSSSARPPPIRSALNRDIKNISGATLSCRHVTDGVQRLLQLYRHRLRRHDDAHVAARVRCSARSSRSVSKDCVERDAIARDRCRVRRRSRRFIGCMSFHEPDSDLSRLHRDATSAAS